MATRVQVEEFRSNTAGLVDLAKDDLRAFWEALDLAGNPLLVRDALEEFMPLLIETYGDAAGVLGADFYEELRDATEARFVVAVGSSPSVTQVQASTRWALGPLFQPVPNPAQALLNIEGSTQRLVLQAARDSIFDSAAKDPVRTGFARVPRGAKTCKFCTMIASRGAVYSSARNAGQSNEWHDDCDCVITAVRSAADFPEGYDPDEFLKLYADGVGVGQTD